MIEQRRASKITISDADSFFIDVNGEIITFKPLRNVPGFDGQVFLVPEGMEGNISAILQDIAAQEDFSGLRTDMPYVFMPVAHIVSKDGAEVNGHVVGRARNGGSERVAADGIAVDVLTE